MQFETQVCLQPYLFYEVKVEGKPMHFFPITQLEPSPCLKAIPYDLAANICTNFSIKVVGQAFEPKSPADVVGFLFRSNLPVRNLGTAILSYARAWQQSAENVFVTQDELSMSLKDEHFLLYHAPGKASFVTSYCLDEALHDYLTMI